MGKVDCLCAISELAELPLSIYAARTSHASKGSDVRTREFCVGAGRHLIWVLAALALSACGGGGGGGGGGSGSGGSGSGSYTIGGTVSGLSASGLVLADNGGNDLSVASGATSFTFSTALQSGASYAVTVATQPTGEGCTVSGGSGTVSGNVTTVKVTCSAQTFSISGSISGDVAAGLKLQYYSGGEVLSVAGGATTFAFTQPVLYGTDVKMVVTAQPSWQTCTPGTSDFSGAITQNITTDTLTCAAPSAVVSTFASSSDFEQPVGVAVDSSGNVYVADTQDNQILKITSAGTVSVWAGSGTAGSADGQGTAADFNRPYGVAVDAAGYVYVADTENNEVRKISPTADVTTLAGGFNTPQGVAVDSQDNVYVADSGHNQIQEVTSSGVVTLFAGSGANGSADGAADSATFSFPQGVAVDSSGNVYVADSDNQEIREIVSGQVSTLAGSPGTVGHADGTGAAASFNGPVSVAVDSAGNVYVADSNNDEIRLVAPNGLVTTLAGAAGVAGSANGSGSAARFSSPSGVAVDAAGNLYVGDLGNKEVREIVPGS